MMLSQPTQKQQYLYEKIRSLEQNVARFTDHSVENEHEELLVAVEELHVAEEELRQQNAELYEAHTQLMHERQKYQILFELSPVGHVLTTPSGEILEANKAIVNLLEFTDKFLAHKPLHEFVLDSSQLAFVLAEVQPLQIVRCEMLMQPRIGEPIVTSVTVTHLIGETGAIEYLLWVIDDLRDQKRAAQLEHQLLAQKMQAQLNAEQTVNDLKTEMMTIVSHSFRTPLAIIQAASSNLEAYFDRLSVEKRHFKFQLITDQIRHLAELLDEVDIVINGVNHIGELNRKPLNIHNHCIELLDEIRAGYGHLHTITFEEGDLPPFALVDVYLLDLILRNLINNAVLYSDLNTEILIKVFRSQNDLVFEVVDHGIGILLVDQPLIFKAIQRGSNVSNRPGLGLGLRIAKECAELHGGSLTFTSAENVGTTFTLRLPVF